MRICGPHFYQGEEKLPLKLLPFSSTILPYADTYSHYGAKHVGYPYREPMLYVILCSQGRIKAGADGAAAPGPHPNIGPPLH